MRQLQEFFLTDKGQTVRVVMNDAWLQLATGSFVAMYVIGDLLSQVPP